MATSNLQEALRNILITGNFFCNTHVQIRVLFFAYFQRLCLDSAGARGKSHSVPFFLLGDWYRQKLQRGLPGSTSYKVVIFLVHTISRSSSTNSIRRPALQSFATLVIRSRSPPRTLQSKFISTQTPQRTTKDSKSRIR